MRARASYHGMEFPLPLIKVATLTTFNLICRLNYKINKTFYFKIGLTFFYIKGIIHTKMKFCHH